MAEGFKKSSRMLPGWVAAAGTVGVGVCLVLAVYLTMSDQGGEIFGILTYGGMFVTNCVWPFCVPIRRDERVGLAAMFPWAMNFTIAGLVFCGVGLLVLKVDIHDIESAIVGAVTLLAVGVGTGIAMRGFSGWKVLLAACALGGVQVGVGVICLIAGWMSYGLDGMGYMILGAVSLMWGLMMGIPTGIGAALVRWRSKKSVDPMECGGCGYNLMGTVQAEIKNCPECGLTVTKETVEAFGKLAEKGQAANP